MKLLKRIGFSLAFIIAVVALWGMAVEPYLIDSKEVTAELPRLPAAWQDQRVALVADFQVGMWFDNVSTIERIVERILADKPALILIAGDFIYHPLGDESKAETREELRELEQEDIDEVVAEIATAVERLEPLTAANIPTYAVLGNHDYGMQTPSAIKIQWLAEVLEEKLETAGIQVLENEAVAVAPPLQSSSASENAQTAALYVVGIGSRYAGNDKPTVALNQVPDDAARLVLMHNPESFVDFPPESAPVALAGHTHGGQIRLPFTDSWSWMTLLEGDPVHADGWIDDYGQAGNRLYVNRGIGFSLLPLRINAVPELTWLTLQSATRF